MTDDEHHGSFDPKTWLKIPADGKKDGADTKTDKADTPKAADKPVRETVASADGNPPPPPGGFDRYRNLVGLGVAVVILGAGGLTAHFSAAKKAAIAGPVAAADTAKDAAAVAATSGSAVVTAPATNTTTRSMNIASLADLLPALTASGVTDAQKIVAAATAILKPNPGQIRLTLKLSNDVKGELEEANIAYSDSSGATVVRGADGNYAASAIKAVLKSVVIVKRGEMDTESFYSSAVTAGITDSLIPDFAKAFAYDFDFQREIAPGDIFEAAFEQNQNAAGEAVGPPHLIYASLTTAAKSKALYFFKPDGADAGWFDGNGQSIIRSFMRTPIDGAHITSQFGMRVHPVLGFMKMHKGTDFGAPVGTPIFAAGDGTVSWAAMKGPNGNLTVILHDNGWQTFYLHQNEFAPGITAGVRVHQGQTIGFVGTTGRSTGPHLHYEMHINNEPVDAMSQPMESGHSLSGPNLAAFDKERDRIDLMRSQATQ